MKPTAPNQLAACLRDYFMDHLPRLRGLSPNTVLSYRDSLVLLLRFLAKERKREACDLDLDDIDPDQVLAFLNHLEQDRPKRRADTQCPARCHSRLLPLCRSAPS